MDKEIDISRGNLIVASDRPAEISNQFETNLFWMDNQSEYNDHLELNLSSVQASLAGPKRPQDRINLNGVSANFQKLLQGDSKKSEVKNHNYQLTDGDVVIAAITSCTNTSNPNVLVAAGLVAKKASELEIGRAHV